MREAVRLQLSRRGVTIVGFGIAMAMGFLILIVFADIRAQGEDNEIHACAGENSLRVVDGPGDCRGNEQPVSWSVQGPEGPPGPEGPAGPPGEPGATDVRIDVTDERSVDRGIHGFIRFDDLVGEVAIEEFKGWSRITAVDHGLSVPLDPITGLPTGAPNISNIDVVKELDVLSPALGERLVSGMHFNEVEIVFVVDPSDPSTEYLRYNMSNAVIAQIEWQGSEPDDRPRLTESISLAFDKFEIVYTPELDGAPPATGTWTRGPAQ